MNFYHILVKVFCWLGSQKRSASDCHLNTGFNFPILTRQHVCCCDDDYNFNKPEPVVEKQK
jgi:hypothetical protein